MAAREFRRYNPPQFDGEPNPIAAEDWLNQIHRILNLIDVREDHVRVALATFQFTGEAYQWWLYEEESRDIASLTWKQFNSIFLEKYFPPAARQARAAEFFALT